MTTEMWARVDSPTPRCVAVRIEADPLGPVNQIVRLVRYGANGTTTQVKAALWRIPAGAEVSLHRVDTPTWSAWDPSWRLLWTEIGMRGYQVTIDGHMVLCATDSEIWPPTPAEPVPRRVRTHRAVKSWLRTRVRAAGDRIAHRFGYVHEDEAGGW